MNIEEVREYCLTLPHTIECMPFTKFPAARDILVFKVAGKMFLMMPLLSTDPRITIKVSTVLLDELHNDGIAVEVSSFPYWYDIYLDRSSNSHDNEIRKWILRSHQAVVAGFSRKKRLELGLE